MTETCRNKNLLLRRMLEEPLVQICRSSHSTMDPKYSLNVLVISLFLKMLSSFSFNIMSVHALPCLFENEDLPKKVYFLWLDIKY